MIQWNTIHSTTNTIKTNKTGREQHNTTGKKTRKKTHET